MTARPDVSAGPETTNLLEIVNLTTGFSTDDGKIRVLENVSYRVPEGTTIGLVGESGCGKSVSVMTVMRLLPSPPSFIETGRILFEGENLVKVPDARMREIRGNRIGMIFQEPMTSLNPTFSIGFQLREVLRVHRGLSKRDAHDMCVRMIETIGIGAPEQRMKQYPYELSGGLRQRIMIAMALVCRPKLLIADEPTTALDVTIQAQILELLANLQEELGMSILLITHDLGVVAEFCRYVYVMYAGRIVEHAPVDDVFLHPVHPYTRGLLASRPRLSERKDMLPTIPGMVPNPATRHMGCYYADRCERVRDQCLIELPPLRNLSENHYAACWEPYL
jgi:oligopeptide/dipeptide ABC transporter ATP-binding protein